jgi:hypothetical protein
MDVNRHAVRQQAARLWRDIQDAMPPEGANYHAQWKKNGVLVDLIDAGRNSLWPQLQNVVFNDINKLDDAVVVLNEWNEVFRDTIDVAKQAEQRLRLLPKNKFETIAIIHEFIIELGKVLTRCILRVGQLSGSP